MSFSALMYYLSLLPKKISSTEMSQKGLIFNSTCESTIRRATEIKVLHMSGVKSRNVSPAA